MMWGKGFLTKRYPLLPGNHGLSLAKSKTKKKKPPPYPILTGQAKIGLCYILPSRLTTKPNPKIPRIAELRYGNGVFLPRMV